MVTQTRTIRFLLICCIWVHPTKSLEREDHEQVGRISLPQSLNIGNFKIENDYWRASVREAVDKAGAQLQRNLIVVLTEMGRDSLQMSRTIKYNIGSLVTALVNTTFDFGVLIVSTPKLLTEALPVQLVSVLRGIQANSNVTRELNSSISTVVDWIEDVEESGIFQNFIQPATNVVPNLMYGVNRFLVSILNGFFYIIGARDPSAYLYTTTDSTVVTLKNLTFDLSTPSLTSPSNIKSYN